MKIRIDVPGYRREFECEEVEVRFASDTLYLVGVSKKAALDRVDLAIERAKNLIRNRRSKTAWKSTLAERVNIKPYIEEVWEELGRDPDFRTGRKRSTYIGGKNEKSG